MLPRRTISFFKKLSQCETSSHPETINYPSRQVYYKQRNYFFANQKYSDSIRELNFFKDLKLKKTPFNGVSWPPKITLTPSGWEAFVTWENKNIIIRKDGKVWVE